MTTLPTVTPLVLWRSTENIRVVANYLIDLIAVEPRLSRTALASYPAEHLQDSGIVNVFISDAPLNDNGIQGSYDSVGPTIRYNRSRSPERDAFTVLHEFGHHVQRSTAAWSFGVLSKLNEFDRTLLEEQVCDEFASRILIDDSAVAAAGSPIDSQFLEQLHRRSRASRRATVMRARGLTDERLLLGVVDSAGTVDFCVSTTSEIVQVPAGSIQPDFARLFAVSASTARTAHGTTQDGLRYSTGNSRSDLALSVTVDSSGLFAFVSAKPTYAYGDQLWRVEERECNSVACGEIFTWTADTVVCYRCGEPVCPVCRACGCEPEHAPVCPNCFFELSLADVNAGRTEHDECP